jgi:hypothetical protein
MPRSAATPENPAAESVTLTLSPSLPSLLALPVEERAGLCMDALTRRELGRSSPEDEAVVETMGNAFPTPGDQEVIAEYFRQRDTLNYYLSQVDRVHARLLHAQSRLTAALLFHSAASEVEAALTLACRDEEERLRILKILWEQGRVFPQLGEVRNDGSLSLQAPKVRGGFPIGNAIRLLQGEVRDLQSGIKAALQAGKDYLRHKRLKTEFYREELKDYERRLMREPNLMDLFGRATRKDEIELSARLQQSLGVSPFPSYADAPLDEEYYGYIMDVCLKG